MNIFQFVLILVGIVPIKLVVDGFSEAVLEDIYARTKWNWMAPFSWIGGSAGHAIGALLVSLLGRWLIHFHGSDGWLWILFVVLCVIQVGQLQAASSSLPVTLSYHKKLIPGHVSSLVVYTVFLFMTLFHPIQSV